MEVVKPVKRNVLLNPGPATTSDAVKYAQVIPDICPREQEFVDIMTGVRKDLVKVVHGDPEKYTAVIFTGSGTIIQDVLVNSLVPEGKKICVVNNGAYAARMVEIAEYYKITVLIFNPQQQNCLIWMRLKRPSKRTRILQWLSLYITRPEPAF